VDNRRAPVNHWGRKPLGSDLGLFSTGLRIEHAIEGYPDPVVFWTFHFNRVRAQLEALENDWGQIKTIGVKSKQFYI